MFFLYGKTKNTDHPPSFCDTLSNTLLYSLPPITSSLSKPSLVICA